MSADQQSTLTLAETLESAARQLRALVAPRLPRVSACVPNTTFVEVGTEPARVALRVPMFAAAASHLVVLREEDPHTGFWQVPLDPAPTHFWRVRLMLNVGPEITTWPDTPAAKAHALARLDLPARCCAITDDHIVDLRRLEGAS